MFSRLCLSFDPDTGTVSEIKRKKQNKVKKNQHHQHPQKKHQEIKQNTSRNIKMQSQQTQNCSFLTLKM